MKIANLSSLLLASFSGKLIYALASVISLPLAAYVLGAEAVGLVGFFTTLLMVLMVLEGGLTSNVIQRLARIRGVASADRSMRSVRALVNTYLLVFSAVGLIAACAISLASPALVSHWLKLTDISQDQALYALYCMAIFIGLNLPVMLLQGVFVGNELQYPLNKVYIVYSLMRTLGILGLVHSVPAFGGVTGYFTLQVLIQLMYVATLMYVLYRRDLLGAGRVHKKYVLSGLAFSRGVFLISLTSVITVQYDKLFMSGALGLQDYAYYSLASTIAGFPYIFSTAFNTVLFPRFSRDLRAGELARIEKVFRAALVLFALIMTIMCSAVFWYAGAALHMMFEPFFGRGYRHGSALAAGGHSTAVLVDRSFLAADGCGVDVACVPLKPGCGADYLVRPASTGGELWGCWRCLQLAALQRLFVWLYGIFYVSPISLVAACLSRVSIRCVGDCRDGEWLILPVFPMVVWRGGGRGGCMPGFGVAGCIGGIYLSQAVGWTQVT